VFSIAFYLWWRRLKHWSFALLSVATALSVIAQVCGSLAINIPRFGKTEDEVAVTQDIWALVQASLVLHLVMGVLLLIGGLGLLAAARDHLRRQIISYQTQQGDIQQMRPNSPPTP